MYPKSHRAHDYPFLIHRWQNLCQSRGLEIYPYAEADGYKGYCVKSPALAREGGIYISAGIHGDEAASTEALLAWATQTRRKLSNLPLILFPCLNPWGLVENSRRDASGRDLNRVWDNPTSPLVSNALREIQGMYFDLALMLHEDYDAQGFYIYEPPGKAPGWGDDLVRGAGTYIPPDPRNDIEGRAARHGVVRPKKQSIPKSSQPEAVYMHLHHAKHTFTLETPSEFSIDIRVKTQVRLIEKAITLWKNSA